MVESALSPPYDGSEFQDLFPELTGVEPDEMVDIESLADHAASSLQQPDDVVENQSVMLNDNVSIQSLDSNSGRGSDYESDISEEEAEPEEDADELLRYLIAPVRQSNKKTNKRLRRQSSKSNDSERFSDSLQCQPSSFNHHQDSLLPSTTRTCVVTTRKYTKTRRSGSGTNQMPASSSTCFTVIDEKGSRKSIRGPNRNAVMAKLNRERKKQLMVDLEGKVGLLNTENDALKKQNVRLRKKVDVLRRELQYMKNVLANQSTLSSLLKNIKATGLEFHTSMAMPLQSSQREVASDISLVQKRKRQFDHDYCLEQNDEVKSRKLARSGSVATKVEAEMTNENLNQSNSDTDMTEGVCLHVSGKSVSLEFCSKCSVKARLAGSRS